MNRFRYALICARADRALDAAIRGDYARVGRVLDKLNRQDYGLAIAFAYWVDATVEHASGGLPGARTTRGKLVVWNKQTGDVMVPDAVGRGPAVDWAIAVVDARSSGHDEAFRRLFRELPADDAELAGSYVAALLAICAASINDFPRGYAAHTTEMARREKEAKP